MKNHLFEIFVSVTEEVRTQITETTYILVYGLWNSLKDYFTGNALITSDNKVTPFSRRYNLPTACQRIITNLKISVIIAPSEHLFGIWWSDYCPVVEQQAF